MNIDPHELQTEKKRLRAMFLTTLSSLLAPHDPYRRTLTVSVRPNSKRRKFGCFTSALGRTVSFRSSQDCTIEIATNFADNIHSPWNIDSLRLILRSVAKAWGEVLVALSREELHDGCAPTKQDLEQIFKTIRKITALTTPPDSDKVKRMKSNIPELSSMNSKSLRGFSLCATVGVLFGICCVANSSEPAKQNASQRRFREVAFDFINQFKKHAGIISEFSSRLGECLTDEVRQAAIDEFSDEFRDCLLRRETDRTGQGGRSAAHKDRPRRIREFFMHILPYLWRSEASQDLLRRFHAVHEFRSPHPNRIEQADTLFSPWPGGPRDSEFMEKLASTISKGRSPEWYELADTFIDNALVILGPSSSDLIPRARGDEQRLQKRRLEKQRLEKQRLEKQSRKGGRP